MQADAEADGARRKRPPSLVELLPVLPATPMAGGSDSLAVVPASIDISGASVGPFAPAAVVRPENAAALARAPVGVAGMKFHSVIRGLAERPADTTAIVAAVLTSGALGKAGAPMHILVVQYFLGGEHVTLAP